MFEIAFLAGIYSYIVFSLGILGLLTGKVLIAVSISFLLFCGLYFYKAGLPFFYEGLKRFLKRFRASFLFKIFFLLIAIQVFINLLAALGPELGFDALWYHLTIPRIYLLENRIFFIPGNLLYYSGLPKLGEMLYLGVLAFVNSAVLPKLIHFGFGILTMFVIYKIARKFLESDLSMLSCLIFYSSLVVSWQSTTAYIDLQRTFFEALALLGFINWIESKNFKWLVESGVVLGLAASTKLLAAGSLFIFLILIAVSNYTQNKRFYWNLLLYLLIVLFVLLPWLVFSYLNTGNPIYPVFSKFYPLTFSYNIASPISFIKDLWIVFAKASDPISPIYIIVLPFVFLVFRKFDKVLKLVCLYCLLAIFVWYATPRTGGGRFILPYLPAFSVLVCAAVEFLKIKKIRSVFIYSAVLFSIISIIYRFEANKKFIPLILGAENKDVFLTKNLNFSFGDFYDVDGYFKNKIKPEDKVLIYGVHNLYYVDFPFVHESYVRKGDKFNYILVQNGNLPDRFFYWKKVYENDKTNVKLFSAGGDLWEY